MRCRGRGGGRRVGGVPAAAVRGRPRGGGGRGRPRGGRRGAQGGHAGGTTGRVPTDAPLNHLEGIRLKGRVDIFLSCQIEDRVMN